MRACERSVTQKGQVTIPRELRSRLGIKRGDKLTFELDGDSIWITRAPSELRKWYGVAEPTRRPEDFRVLREAFEQGVAEEASSEG